MGHLNFFFYCCVCISLFRVYTEFCDFWELFIYYLYIYNTYLHSYQYLIHMLHLQHVKFAFSSFVASQVYILMVAGFENQMAEKHWDAEALSGLSRVTERQTQVIQGSELSWFQFSWQELKQTSITKKPYDIFGWLHLSVLEYITHI